MWTIGNRKEETPKRMDGVTRSSTNHGLIEEDPGGGDMFVEVGSGWSKTTVVWTNPWTMMTMMRRGSKTSAQCFLTRIPWSSEAQISDQRYKVFRYTHIVTKSGLLGAVRQWLSLPSADITAPLLLRTTQRCSLSESAFLVYNLHGIYYPSKDYPSDTSNVTTAKSCTDTHSSVTMQVSQTITRNILSTKSTQILH
jgi:hypothetical protein